MQRKLSLNKAKPPLGLNGSILYTGQKYTEYCCSLRVFPKKVYLLRAHSPKWYHWEAVGPISGAQWGHGITADFTMHPTCTPLPSSGFNIAPKAVRCILGLEPSELSAKLCFSTYEFISLGTVYTKLITNPLQTSSLKSKNSENIK